MTKDEKIAKLGKEITDRATVLLGKDKITPDAPEYLGINSALKFTAVKYDEKMADDILDIALTMKKRVPLTIEQLAKKNPQFDRAYLEKALQALSESGLVEFHWENLDGKNPNHAKRWVLDMFVPGSAEIMMINPEQSDMFPETADFFERMAYLPLAGITEMVPPGGAGIGMHVIPVEKAIPAESKSLPIEHLSHWLKKYEGHIGVSVCSCRKQQRIRGEGSGDVEGEWCIGVGDFADYCRETNHGRDITYEEAMEILQKAEDRGYVHQITNIDGENKIFGICNCAVGVCNALRTSAAVQHAEPVRLRLRGRERPREVRGLRQVRRDLPGRRCPPRSEALHEGRSHPVSAPRAAGRHQVGRGSLEQELPQRERLHPDLADWHGALQGRLPGAHRHPGLHQDGGRRPLCRRAQAHQEG